MMLYGGMLLIIIAIILGAVRYSQVSDLGVAYGTGVTVYYFYGIVGVIGLIGIILAIWAYMKKTEPAKT